MANRLISLPVGFALPILLLGLLTGCQNQKQIRDIYQSGEPVPAGALLYNIVQTEWRTQLGDFLKLRVPDSRYLLVTLSVTNKGRQPVSIPFATMEGSNSKEYREMENGESVDNWFGLIREISPGETRVGKLLFDVPLTSYRLRLTDGGEPGSERNVWVDIPLNLNTNSPSSVDLTKIGQ